MTITARSSTATGRIAEGIALAFLVQKYGFAEQARNWRNRWCEIDLVVRNGEGIHFVEVKYRKTAGAGSGLEYITQLKRDRLIRAAAAWCQAHAYNGPYQIDVLAVTGQLEAPECTYIPNAIEG